MTLELQLPADIEAFYVAQANAKGAPLEGHIAEQLIARASTINERNGAPKPPVRWVNLRGALICSLRREDIYDGRG